jgi:hypothetical protein
MDDDDYFLAGDNRSGAKVLLCGKCEYTTLFAEEGDL